MKITNLLTEELLREILENAFEGIVVTDPAGIILFMNETYKKFLEVADVVGQHVTDVIENTRMHIVGNTGKAEIAGIQRIKKHDMIANRIPIYINNELVAVLGTVIFQDVRQLHALSATIDRLKQEVNYYKEELRRKLSATYGFEQIVGNSVKLDTVKQLARKVAKTDATVLLMGESGTGKELFAHAIHAESRRQLGPLIRVNCAAIPEALLESELFGYEEGAFTGALKKGKKGKFELANRGTILLDEIGDMPLNLQSKLLRVLQEKEIERVGGTHPIAIDVRLISSTNRNLLELTEQGQFREDLFYRLHVVSLQIPSLRERMEDLPILVKDLLEQLSESTGILVKKIHEGVWNTLLNYSWPGNIRELRNVLERALHLMEEDYILKTDHILLPMRDKRESIDPVGKMKDAVRQAEIQAIQRALVAAKGDKRQAAQILDISKSSLYQKIEEYRIGK